jgi:hypothetical protein
MNNQTKTSLQEVYFYMCDMANDKKLPEEFRSWREFFLEQADKLSQIESDIFGKGS